MSAHPASNAAEADTRNAVLAIIAVMALLRVVFGATLGLGVDEAYTVATSRPLQMGYFDHPPLAWWIAWATRFVTGSESPLVVRLPFIALFCLTTWFAYASTRMLYGHRAGLWAVVAINIPPVIGWASGTFVLPDGPLYAALMGGSYVVARVLFLPGQSPLLWLAAGAAGGLAMLSKLHGAFLFAGVFVFLLWSPRHRFWLATPWPYAGVLVALVIFSPTLIWLAQHDWISFTFQANRGQVRKFSIVPLLALLGGQMAYLLPLVWLALVAIWLRALRRGMASPPDCLLACIAAGPIAVFTFVGLTADRALPHWAMPGYLILMPLLGHEIARALELARRWVKPWLWLCIGTTAVALPAVITLALLPWPSVSFAGKPVRDPLIETLDWRDLNTELTRRGLTDGGKLVIVSPRWHEAGKIDVALQGRMPVLALSHDPRGYGVNVRAADYIGRDAIIAGRTLHPDAVRDMYAPYFDQIERLPDVVLTRAGRPTMTLNVYRGTNLHAANRSPDLLDPLGLWAKRGARGPNPR